LSHGHVYAISQVIQNDSFEKVDFSINVHGLVTTSLMNILNFFEIFEILKFYENFEIMNFIKKKLIIEFIFKFFENFEIL
jgi:hypothetical protein